MIVLQVKEVQRPWGGGSGGRLAPLAYGVVTLPCTSGYHRLSCTCVRVLPRDCTGLYSGVTLLHAPHVQRKDQPSC
ncbi:MAG: hypothetical protein HC767_00075 [Akkermansiaceae bacterium]|nr:hypothetical protein [Akkermansiaceae bacterium]